MYDRLGYNIYQNKLKHFIPTEAELLSFPKRYIGKNMKVFFNSDKVKLGNDKILCKYIQ